MVLIALIILTVLAGIYVGTKTQPFDIFAAAGVWTTCAVLSVVILGAVSWHSEPYMTTHNVDEVVVLENGVAVGVDDGTGIYIRHSVTRYTDNCDEPYLREVRQKTYPYATITPITTRTTYTLCLPDPIRP